MAAPSLLQRHRHLLAPVAGAAVLLVLSVGLDVGLTLAIVAALLTWGGGELVLAPDNPLARLRGRADLGVDPALLETELGEARARIRGIEAALPRISDDTISQPLDAIARSADLIIEEVVRDPRDYPRVRKALVHYLGHAGAVANGLVVMQRTGRREDVERKARAMLPKLAEAFERFRERMSENEAFDVETRMDMLARELGEASPAEDGSRTTRDR
jgi:hypothetical protein